MENEGQILPKNSRHRITLFDMNNLGCGVGKIGEKIVFVRGGVDGDTVDVKIIKDTARYAVAIVESMVSPSPFRREKGMCQAAGKCGGCVYANVTYDHELGKKRAYVQSVFAKAGMGMVPVGETLTDGVADHYRNKAQYPVCAGEREAAIGFYAPKSHRVVDIGESCALQPKIFGEIVAFLRQYLREEGLFAYDENTGRGLVRHLYLRQAVSGETVVCLVLNGSGLPDEAGFVRKLRAAFPQVAGVLLNENTESTNVILGAQYRALWGSKFLSDTLCGVRLKIGPAAFYQVNHGASEILYAQAAARAGLTGREILLDLYCGVGSIGLSMAGQAKRVIGIEIVPEAVECARENAVENRIDNADFFCGDASLAKEILKKSCGVVSPDVVVLDPPRKGCDEKLFCDLRELSPRRIVYISCNPDTLARDAVRLSAIGYVLCGEVTPVNLFPRTAHVECVCAFEKRERPDERA